MTKQFLRPFIVALALCVGCAVSSLAATYTVNDLGDAPDATPGDNICATAGSVCTLRAAIMEANAHAGPDTITFSVSGTISPASGYESLTGQVTIDGTGAPGYMAGGAPEISIQAPSTNSVFDLGAGSDGSSIIALKMGGAGVAAVEIHSSNVVLQRNYIGPIPAGAINSNGVLIDATSSGDTIGGATHGLGNVISGNSATGITIEGANNIIRDNYIGTTPDGLSALGNGDGIEIGGLAATGNMIGTHTPGTANVISGNGANGVWVRGVVGAAVTGTEISGNFIGTDATGSVALGNVDGIRIELGINTIVGNSGARNVISGNSDFGVLNEPGSTGTQITASYIGVDATGTVAIGNGGGIVEDGTNSAIGQALAGQGNLISGNLMDGIDVISDTQSTTIRSNIIGLDATGMTALGNGRYGITMTFPSQVTIGGTAAGAGNIVSGNGLDGINIGPADQLTIEGNTIGLAADGTTIRGNTGFGIALFGATHATIGAAGGGMNVISGNSGSGIELSGITAVTGSQSVTVGGNRIGTDAIGTSAKGNLADGIEIVDSVAVDLSANQIEANSANGVLIHGASSGIRLFGNLIGVDVANGALPNLGDGVRVAETANGNTIGSVTLGGNSIANNAGAGIAIVDSATSNQIAANSITSNGGLGIDLGADGVTPNDAQDPDTGPNQLQNFPILATAAGSATGTAIEGTLNSTPSSTFTLHFYSDSSADAPSGHGEGTNYLGTMNVTTDASGDATYRFTGTATTPGEFVTATATGVSGTSEFASDLVVTVAPTVQFSSGTYSVSESGGSATITVTRTGDTSVTSTVDFATSNGNATAGSDYASASGTLTFAPGVTSETFDVSILDDHIHEPDETVNLTLSNPTGASLVSPSTAVLTIRDNDPAPPVPTLSGWMLLALATCLGLIAVRAVR